MNNGTKYNYRGDIDGLRAVAVFAVILNHFYSEFAPSGFLGVDIFFVISGYVITQSLVSIKSEGWFDYLAGFYAQRVRRLLPALIFCVVLTTFFFVFLTSDPQREIFVTGGLSLFGLSNLYLLKIASGYFSIDAHLNPFTHTWSLGVEEQFYFIYPALIAFSGLALVKVERAWIKTVTVLIVLSVASFLLYIFSFNNYPVFSFYSMPARFWEFSVGAIAFILINRFLPNAFLGKWRGVILVVLFAGLIGLFFVSAEYQLYTTTLSVFFSAGLIVLSVPGLYVTQLLCSRPFLYFGMLSYSLYLWHWSVLVLGRYTVGDSLVASLFLLLIMFGFSLFSYYFIERPMRYTKFLNGRVKPLCLVVILVVPLSYFIVREVPDIRVGGFNFASLMGVEAAPSWAGSIQCHGDNQNGDNEAFFNTCLRPERTAERPHVVFLLGDSHAAQLTFMFDKAVQNIPYSLRFAHNASDNDFPRSFLSGRSGAPTLDYVLRAARQGDVVAIAMHRGRLNKDRDRHVDMSVSIGLDERAVIFEEYFSKYVDLFVAKGVKVLLIRDTPLMSVVAASEACNLQVKLFGESVCRVSKEQDLHTRKKLDVVYDNLRSRYAGIYVWDPLAVMYSDGGYVDVVDETGQYIMMDSHHITRYQSEGMAADFSGFIKSQVLK